MEKRQVIENLNKSLLIIKDTKTVTLSDKTLKTLKDSIEEALILLGNDFLKKHLPKKSPKLLMLQMRP